MNKEIKKENWFPAWGFHIQNYTLIPAEVENITQEFRFINNISGNKIRLMLSNLYSTKSLRIQKITVKSSQGDRVVTSGGRSEILLSPDEERYTDPLPLTVHAGEMLTICIYIKEKSVIHGYAGMNSSELCDVNFYRGDGTFTDRKVDKRDVCGVVRDGFNKRAYFGIKMVSILTDKPVKTIAAFGDSLVHHGHWVNAVWSRIMKERSEIAVINEGISGNRVLRDGNSVSRHNRIFGQAGIARFKHDLFSRFTPDLVIIAEGINDLVHPGYGTPLSELPNAETLIDGLALLNQNAKEQGAKTLLATLSPFYGYDEVWDEQREQVRQAVNSWVRSQSESDGYVDIDLIVRDQSNPLILDQNYDSGDHLHFNQEGGRKIALDISLDMIYNLLK